MAVETLHADPNRVAGIQTSPCPSCYRTDASGKIDLFPQVGITGRRRRTLTVGQDGGYTAPNADCPHRLGIRSRPRNRVECQEGEVASAWNERISAEVAPGKIEGSGRQELVPAGKLR